MTHLCDAIL